jgi:ribosomal protein S18 acetylase RimI-like enzyme
MRAGRCGPQDLSPTTSRDAAPGSPTLADVTRPNRGTRGYAPNPGAMPGEPELRIRPATAEDERVIHALHARCFRNLFAGLLGDWVAPSEQRADRERSWTGPIGAPRERHALLLAERRQRVIGLVAVGPTRDAEGDRRTTGELMTIMVDANQRGLGVGSALMTAGERAMRTHGLALATLWVVPENTPAVRLYERCGWAPDDTKKLMDIGGQEITAVRYRKTLRP